MEGCLPLVAVTASSCSCTETKGYMVIPSSVSQNTSPRMFCTAKVSSYAFWFHMHSVSGAGSISQPNSSWRF